MQNMKALNLVPCLVLRVDELMLQKFHSMWGNMTGERTSSFGRLDIIKESYDGKSSNWLYTKLWFIKVLMYCLISFPGNFII